ncbi:MAG: CD225/dispanin family protein [Prevotella sp.]
MSDNYTIDDDGATNRPGNHGRTLKPDNNLVWSIICVSVFLPFGLLALIESVKVDSLF